MIEFNSLRTVIIIFNNGHLTVSKLCTLKPRYPLGSPQIRINQVLRTFYKLTRKMPKPILYNILINLLLLYCSFVLKMFSKTITAPLKFVSYVRIDILPEFQMNEYRISEI